MKILNLGAIVLDGRLQSRVEINEEAVADYAHVIEEEGQLPPITVMHDGISYFLVDGFHRYLAHKRAERVSIACEVLSGTFRDAQLYATGVNATHGMRRSHADKRKAVMTLLDDFEWSGWSNAEIAKQCGVSGPFVKMLREALDQKPEEVKMTTSTGKVATRKAENKKPERTEKAEEKQEEKPDNAHIEVIDSLQAENNGLKDRLAIAAMDATPEEKALAEQTIGELREQIRILEIELIAVKKSRDQYQNECAQMKKQIAILQKKLKD